MADGSEYVVPEIERLADEAQSELDAIAAPVRGRYHQPGFTTEEFSEYYGITGALAGKVIAVLILRGELTVLGSKLPAKYVASRVAKNASYGVTATHLNLLMGGDLQDDKTAIRKRIKAAHDAGACRYVNAHGGQYILPPEHITGRTGEEVADISVPLEKWDRGNDRVNLESIMPELEPTAAELLRDKHKNVVQMAPASSPSRAAPPAAGRVERTTAGLRDALFDALDDLRGPKPDVAKALATAKIAQAIIGSAKAELDFRTRLNQDKKLDADFKDGTLRLGSEPA